MIKMKTKIVSFILLIPLCTSLAQVRNAEFEIHDRGNLWETMKDNGTIGAPDPNDRFETYPSMDWPGGPHEMSKDDQRSYNVAGGMWIGGKFSDGSIFFNENGPFQFVDDGTFEELSKVNNFVEDENYNPNQPEQEIIARWTTSDNITIERRSKAWSFIGLNNFIIMEYTITNNNTSSLNDVYIGFPNLIRPSYQDFVVHNGWGDDFNRADESVRYDDSRALLYAYDNTPNFSLPDDVGNYYNFNELNELRTTGYAGYALLDAADGKNGEEQPSNVLFVQLLNNAIQLTTVSNSTENLYDVLSGVDRSLQASEEDLLVPFMLMSVGPYDLSASETIKIVMVEAVAGLPQEEAIKGLEAQSLLPAGEDSLKSTIDRAKILYQNNYQLSAVPPPSPHIDLIPVPENQSITILWNPIDETWVDPISRINEIREFRIYRSDRAFTGPYQLIRRINLASSSSRDRFYNNDIGKWVYEDQSISLGAGYYYSITSLDAEGDESWFTNRNEEAVFAASAPAENTLDITVFPNPFREISGFPTSGAENSIVWSNLPATCTIRIFTSNGELVKRMDHDNQFSGEEIWNQLSDARQQTAPGIYFWTVESDVGTAKGTLLIIK